MPDIRVMSWNIENYGFTKARNSSSLPEFIACTMALENIDILVILELRSDYNPFPLINDHLKNDNYRTNGTWCWKVVPCGGERAESVGFLWYEETNGGKFWGIKNTNNRWLADTIWIDTSDQPLYFPRKNTPWDKIQNSAPNGRRPAYMIFQTEKSIFSVAGLHAPCNDSSLIQAFSAHQYGCAREREKFSFVSIGENLSELKSGNPGFDKVINDVITLVTPHHSIEKDIARHAIKRIITVKLALRCYLSKVYAFQTSVFTDLCLDGASYLSAAHGSSNHNDNEKLARALLVITASAALILQRIWCMPPKVLDCVIEQYKNIGSYTYNKTLTLSKNVENAFNKKKVPDDLKNYKPAYENITCSVFSGDFNIPYPDINEYTPANRKILGVNAFSSLSHIDGNYCREMALKNKATTQSSKQDHLYCYSWQDDKYDELKLEAAFDPHLKKLYSDLGTLAGSSSPTYCNSSDRQSALNSVMETNDIKTHSSWINKILPKTTAYNITELMRAKAYDNFSIQSQISNYTNFKADSPDMLSLLGSWKENPGPCQFEKAHGLDKKKLNEAASSFLQKKTPYAPYKKNLAYHAPPTLISVNDAAAFYNDYISDHYPICVTVHIP